MWVSEWAEPEFHIHMHVELVRLRFGKKKMQKQLWVLSMKMQLWLKKDKMLDEERVISFFYPLYG